jgi:sirohydrochlorin cobaltochelatase
MCSVTDTKHPTTLNHSMHAPIILTAFGTSSKATSTYNGIGKKIHACLPETRIILAYSSRVIGRKVKGVQIPGQQEFKHPEEILQELAMQGCDGAILQSLHLFPGTEFHKLAALARRAPLPCAPGVPILTSPHDFSQLAHLLAPTIESRPDRTILILGHGTEHPSWTSYYSLEKIFRQKFGNRIFVGVVEGFPDSDHLIDEIGSLPARDVTIIPLFLVAGMHYRRDIVGGDNSWCIRLKNKGLGVETIEHGIGLVPGIEELVVSHIKKAQKDLLKISID